MPNIYIYNHLAKEIERYSLQCSQPMPYCSILTAGEFCGDSDLAWSDRRALTACQLCCASLPYTPAFAKCFVEIGREALPQSPHYCGLAFCIQPPAAPQCHCPGEGCCCFIKCLSSPCCPAGGYPVIRPGSMGVHVLVLQSALRRLGYPVEIDGVFSCQTFHTLIDFQYNTHLHPDGIAGCQTWPRLMCAACSV